MAKLPKKFAKAGAKYKEATKSIEAAGDRVYEIVAKCLHDLHFTKNYAEIVAGYVASDWVEGQVDKEALDVPWCELEDGDEEPEEPEEEEEIEEEEEDEVEEGAAET